MSVSARKLAAATAALQWAVMEDEHDPYYRHVVPLGDLRPHTTDFNGTPCWCQVRTEEHVVVHNSADHRELYEQGKRTKV